MPPVIYQLEPLVGIVPVRFGMSVQALEDAMPEPSAVFQKVVGGPEVHAYYQNALQVFLGAQRQVEFIELSRSDEVSAGYLGLDLLQTPAQEVIEHLSATAEYDRLAPEQGYTFTFHTLQLALWRPVIPTSKRSKDGRYFKTVGLGCAGYFSGAGGE